MWYQMKRAQSFQTINVHFHTEAGSHIAYVVSAFNLGMAKRKANAHVLYVALKHFRRAALPFNFRAL